MTRTVQTLILPAGAPYWLHDAHALLTAPAPFAVQVTHDLSGIGLVRGRTVGGAIVYVAAPAPVQAQEQYSN